MKKKIVIGLSIFCLVFLLSGIYVGVTIERATATLSNLVMLHQVELMREGLLIQIKRVQSDLSLKDTRYARDFDTIVSNVRKMKTAAESCFTCHHGKDVVVRLGDLNKQIESFKHALSRVLTVSANSARLEIETDIAFKIGERLNSQVNDMILLANANLEKKTHTVLQKINKTKIILFSLIGIGPLLTVGLALFFIRGLTKPLDVMLEATRKLEEGDLDYRMAELQDEFGEVAASFNNMVDSLKEQMVKMQHTEQMVVFGEYAAKMVHEIQSPLAGIKVTLGALPDKGDLIDEDRDLLIKITAEIERIESLLENLLKFARPPKPDFMPVEAGTILTSAINFSRKNYPLSTDNSGKIKIVTEFNDRLPMVMADPLQLQQVFLNLLNNASDAMPDGGVLTIRASHNRSTEDLEIEISDTGKGIEDELLDLIFKPFFTTKKKGTGLGLPITKQLLGQNRGTITVDNRQDKGVTFKITLPVWQGEEGGIG